MSEHKPWQERIALISGNTYRRVPGFLPEQDNVLVPKQDFEDFIRAASVVAAHNAQGQAEPVAPHQPSAPPRVSDEHLREVRNSASCHRWDRISPTDVEKIADDLRDARAEIAALRASMASDRRKAWKAGWKVGRDAAAAECKWASGVLCHTMILALPEPDDACALTPPQVGGEPNGARS